MAEKGFDQPSNQNARYLFVKRQYYKMNRQRRLQRYYKTKRGRRLQSFETNRANPYYRNGNEARSRSTLYFLSFARASNPLALLLRG